MMKTLFYIILQTEALSEALSFLPFTHVYILATTNWLLCMEGSLGQDSFLFLCGYLMDSISFILFYLFIYLFIFGCVGSLLLRAGFL